MIRFLVCLVLAGSLVSPVLAQNYSNPWRAESPGVPAGPSGPVVRMNNNGSSFSSYSGAAGASRVVTFRSFSGEQTTTTVPDFTPLINDASARTMGIAMQFWPWLLGLISILAAIVLVVGILKAFSK